MSSNCIFVQIQSICLNKLALTISDKICRVDDLGRKYRCNYVSVEIQSAIRVKWLRMEDLDWFRSLFGNYLGQHIQAILFRVSTSMLLQNVESFGG